MDSFSNYRTRKISFLSQDPDNDIANDNTPTRTNANIRAISDAMQKQNEWFEIGMDEIRRSIKVANEVN